ncbi:MAG: hypothetical protein NC392_04870 [Roseburia sp.]|nr:hypothetical protein [Roseburia sp.]
MKNNRRSTAGKRSTGSKRSTGNKRNTDSKRIGRIVKLKLPWHRKVRRDVKDRLFRFLFAKDREALLQLYNALNGTDYRDSSALQIVTIESAVYVVMKNDLAFVLAGTLNLYEHQSTYNPNMPVRFLIYLAEEYQKLIDRVGVSLYGSSMIELPTPRCVVFYNGEKDAPEESTLRLSDAFVDKERPGDVELQVRMLNINYGHNKELMDKCRMLAEYAEFVEISRQHVREGMDLQKALNEAIDYCLEHGILYDVLREHRTEVLGMLLEEFDAKKYERTIRMEGIEEGKRQGLEEGKKQIERVNRLNRLLLEQNRIEDLKHAVEDPAYQKLLLEEFDTEKYERTMREKGIEEDRE